MKTETKAHNRPKNGANNRSDVQNTNKETEKTRINDRKSEANLATKHFVDRPKTGQFIPGRTLQTSFSDVQERQQAKAWERIEENGLEYYK